MAVCLTSHNQAPVFLLFFFPLQFGIFISFETNLVLLFRICSHRSKAHTKLSSKEFEVADINMHLKCNLSIHYVYLAIICLSVYHLSSFSNSSIYHKFFQHKKVALFQKKKWIRKYKNISFSQITESCKINITPNIPKLHFGKKQLNV